jgi:hypothetical protein
MRNRNKTFHLLALCCLLSGLAAHAEPTSKSRVAAFARLPDWSGIWERFDTGPGGGPTDPKQQAAMAAALSQLRPPYNATWQATYDKALRKKIESHDPGPLKCDPLGFPEAMLFLGDMIQFAILPEETTIMFYSGGQRHVATDGTPLPPEDERWGTPWGQAVGHWEGEVLVVDTVSTTGAVTTPDRVEAHFSDKVSVRERIRMLDKNTLEEQMTITDAAALKHPWTLTVHYHRIPNMAHLIDYECTEESRQDKSKFVAPK